MSRQVVAAIESEYKRYKALADAAVAQLDDAELGEPGPGAGNSVAVVAWHIAGNLASRFTDFLDSDGEKPWRDREDEFAPRRPSRGEFDERWQKGWRILFAALAGLTDAHLQRTVRIRGQDLAVCAALHRSLAHTAYHVGQIVYLAKALRGARWRYLSIPPGGSRAYEADPTNESGDAHAMRLNQATRGASRLPDTVRIRRAGREDAAAISALVSQLTRDYVAPELTLAGRQHLLASMSEDAIRGYLDAGFEYQIAEHGEGLIGVVATRDDCHLYHLYVADAFQGRGLSRVLWERAKARCIERSGTRRFTVNSSNNAVPVYERLGFVRTGPMREEHGVRFNPMELVSA